MSLVDVYSSFDYSNERDDPSTTHESPHLPFHVVRGSDRSKIEVQRDVKVVVEDDGALV